MKTSVSKLLLCFTATVATLSAQEAWLLQMPNKFADYLVNRSVANDYDKVAGIVEKLPGLIEKKQIREVELIKFKAKEGKVQKNEKITEGERTLTLGSSYRSAGGNGLDRRSLTVTTKPTAPSFNIDSFGILPRAWTPTFIHQGEKLTLILLERHAESKTAVVELKYLRQLEFDAGPDKNRVVWFSGDPLDGQSTTYLSRAVLSANPKIEYGIKIFAQVKKDSDTLLRIEANSTPARATDLIYLHHNEAKFKGLSESSGPLKKEVIKVADKSVTQESDSGEWTLTVRNGEPEAK
jgi:hypothetical protein